MEDFEAIKIICVAEKIINIHRDFWYLTTRNQIFLAFLISLEVALSFAVITYIAKCFFLRYAFKDSLWVIFYLMQNIQCFSIILYYGPFFGHRFRILLDRLSQAHNVLRCHLPYNKSSLIQIKTKVYVVLITIVAVRAGKTVQTVIFEYEDGCMTYLPSILLTVNEVFNEGQYALGILMYYTLLTIVRSMLQAVNELIKEAAMEGSLEDNLNNFACVYRILFESCRKLKKCMAHQILLSLFIGVSFFIYLIWQSLSMLLIQKSKFAKSIWHHIIKYVGSILMITMAGQGVANEVVALKRLLSKLRYTYIDSNMAISSRLKDFQRLVCVEPLQVELLPPLPVGTYILPVVLSLVVDYIIVSLQMNKDI